MKHKLWIVLPVFVLLGAVLLLAAWDRQQVAAAPQPEAWLQAANVPNPVLFSGFAQCADEPDVFYVLGSFPGQTYFYSYNASSNVWTALPDFPMPIERSAVVCYQDKIFAAGGDTYVLGATNKLYIYDIPEAYWYPGLDMPHILKQAAVGIWDGKIYIAGGTMISTPWSPIDHVDIFDIASGAWTDQGGTPVPVPSSSPGYAQIGQYLYVVGGFSGNFNGNRNVTLRYDMATDTWESGPAFTSARAAVDLVATGSHLYAIGGDADGGTQFDPTSLVEALDLSAWPGGSWLNIADPLPIPIEGNSGFCSESVSGGEIWSIGGVDAGQNYLDDVYYRPSEACANFYFGDLTKETDSLSDLPGKVVHYVLPLYNAGTEVDTFDLTASGVWTITLPVTTITLNAGETVDVMVDVEIPLAVAPGDFDLATVTVTSQADPAMQDTTELTTSVLDWIEREPLPEPLAANLVQCADDLDSFYMVGGILENNITSDRLYRYDIGSSPVQLADLPEPRRAVAVACYQGKIYAAGGVWSNYHDSLFIYDIADNSWSTGPSLPDGVWGAGMGAWDGKLYLVGGTRIDTPYTPVSRVDVFDINSGVWTAGGGQDMLTAASFFGVAQDGPYLYAVGGMSGDFEANVDQTQRYNMATDQWEDGPTFTSARALAPLAVTASHLYMLGGDLDGGTAFDATDLVEVLDLSAWPGGAWADLGNPLPAVNIYPATTCSEVLTGGEIWAVGGADANLNSIDDVYYRPTGEPCADFYFGDLTQEAMQQSKHRGEVAHYLLPVYNAGTETDTYDVTASGTWTVTAPASLGPLESGEVGILSIDVEIPMGVNNGDFDTTLVTVTSQGDTNASDMAELTTTAIGWLQAADIPHEVSFYATAQCADDPDGFYLIGGALDLDNPYSEVYRYDASTNQWTYVTDMPTAQWGMATACYGGKLYVAGGLYNGFSLFAYDIAGDNWELLATIPRWVYGAGMGVWDGKLYIVGGYGEDPFIPTEVVSIYDLASDTWHASTMPVASMAYGTAQAGQYLYVVGGYSGDWDNNVNATQRLDMATGAWTQGPEFTSRRGAFGMAITQKALYAMGGDMNGGERFDPTNMVESLDLSQWPDGAWTEVADSLLQEIEGNGSFCSEAMTGGEVWSVGGGYGVYPDIISVDDSYYYPAEPCASYGVELLAPEGERGEIGGAVEYELTITNTGTITDYYGVDIQTTWPVGAGRFADRADAIRPYLGGPGPVLPGESITITIGVDIPGDVLPGDEGISTITVESLRDPSIAAVGEITTIALGYGVTVTPEIDNKLGAPGETLEYTLTVTNMGTFSDTFDIALSGNTWTTTVPADTGWLEPGEAEEVLVMVNIPPDAPPGADDIAVLTFTSQGDPQASATATLTSQTYSFGVELVPETLEASGQPGATLTYTLHLSNTGDTTDTILLSTEDVSWTVTLPVTQVVLASGASVDVVVVVTIPEDALPGESDAIKLIATSQGDPQEWDSSTLVTAVPVWRTYLAIVLK